MPKPRILLTGLVFPESPRWHENRLWFANWGTQENVTLDLDGTTETEREVPPRLRHRITSVRLRPAHAREVP